MATDVPLKTLRRRPWLMILGAAIAVLFLSVWVFWDSRQMKWWACGQLWRCELPDGDELWWQCSLHTGKQVTTCFRTSTPWIEWTFDGTPEEGEHVLTSATGAAEFGRFVSVSQEATYHRIPRITGRIERADGNGPISVTLNPMAHMQWISWRRGLAVGPFGVQRSAKILRPDFLPLTEDLRDLNQFMVDKHSYTLQSGMHLNWFDWWYYVRHPSRSPWSWASYSSMEDAVFTEYRPFVVNQRSWSEVIFQTHNGSRGASVGSLGAYPGVVFRESSITKRSSMLQERLRKCVEKELSDRGISAGTNRHAVWFAMSPNGLVLRVAARGVNGPYTSMGFDIRLARSCEEWFEVPWEDVETLLYDDGPFREFMKQSRK